MKPLSDKLKALGIRQGFKDYHPQQSKEMPELQELISGNFITTRYGDIFVSSNSFPEDYFHGKYDVLQYNPLGFLAEWVHNPVIENIPKEKICFIDTETTGLSGGTGTYSFLIGIGYFLNEFFNVKQIFLQNPAQETAQLSTLENILAPFEVIVSYNGKVFDIPILNNRFILHGWESPFKNLFHIDLLFLARRVWKERLPSRSLASIEANILGFYRSDEDIPGWLVPQLYFDYLIDHNAEPLKRIFYHNLMDVLSLTVLLNHFSKLLNLQDIHDSANPYDLLAIAKLYRERNQYDKAINLLSRFTGLPDEIKRELPENIILEALHLLASIYKLTGNLEMAIIYLVEEAEYGNIPAFIELAKIYEHIFRDYDKARAWSEAAKQLLEEKSPSIDEEQWMNHINHRISRLLKKIEAGKAYL